MVINDINDNITDRNVENTKLQIVLNDFEHFKVNIHLKTCAPNEIGRGDNQHVCFGMFVVARIHVSKVSDSKITGSKTEIAGKRFGPYSRVKIPRGHGDGLTRGFWKKFQKSKF